MRWAMLALMLSGCTGQIVLQNPNYAPKYCTASKINTTTTIVCPDGSSSTVEDGTNAIPVKDGHSAVFSGVVNGSCITLLAATDVDDNGVLDVTDGNIQSVVVCNGADAPPTSFTPVALIDPCGTNPSIHNEVFIKLESGILLASFSDSAAGNNTRFSVLTAGNYITTDGDSCSFSVDANGNVTNESFHY